jgi:hypothetical protein
MNKSEAYKLREKIVSELAEKAAKTGERQPKPCEYWESLDVTFDTPTESPLHHDSRHRLNECKPRNSTGAKERS